MTKDSSAKNTRLGDLVTSHRKAQGRSARDVAREAQIDIHTMTKLEKGHYASPSPLTLKGVARALGIPILELFDAAGYVTPFDLIEMARSAAQSPLLADQQHAHLANEYAYELIERYGLDDKLGGQPPTP